MCKTWSIKYACEDIFVFRLSMCRGTFRTQSKPKRPSKPACSTEPVFVFRCESRCGDCLRRDGERDIDERIAKLELSVTVPEGRELQDAVLARNDELYLISRQYPDSLKRKDWRWPQGCQHMTLRKSSLLRNMELAEDAVVKERSEWDEYYDGWADTSWGTTVASENPTWMAQEQVEDEGVENSVAFNANDLVAWNAANSPRPPLEPAALNDQQPADNQTTNAVWTAESLICPTAQIPTTPDTTTIPVPQIPPAQQPPSTAPAQSSPELTSKRKALAPHERHRRHTTGKHALPSESEAELLDKFAWIPPSCVPATAA